MDSSTVYSGQGNLPKIPNHFTVVLYLPKRSERVHVITVLESHCPSVCRLSVDARLGPSNEKSMF